MPIMPLIAAAGSFLTANAAGIGAIAALTAAGTGVYSAVASGNKSSSGNINMPVVETPKPQDSLLAAQKAADDRRRIAAATGGNVNITGGLGTSVASSNLRQKTLLGG